MKTETLESLFIDRALGELSPEAADLLAAWCDEHPEHATLARPIERSLQLARNLAVEPMPRAELPTPRWQQSVWRARGVVWLRLAASLALGVGLGWLAHPKAPTAGPAASMAFSPRAEATIESPASSRFWSISARVEAARRKTESQNPDDAPRHRPRSSLLQMPQPESKS